jgi:hypothetical protein
VFSSTQPISLSDDVKKVIVNTLLSRVSVFFDGTTSKHRLEVEFSEEVSRLLEEDSHQSNDTEDVEEMFSECLETVGEDAEDVPGRIAGKKSENSWVVPATFQNYSVTVK